MKKLSLLGLLVVGACVFQACHSPESRATKGDTAQTDTGSKTGTSTGADNGASSSPASSTESTQTESSAANDSSSKKETTSRNITNESKVSSDAAGFMKTAAIGGMMEVELGKIALKSTNPKVKAFAEQMVKDHSKANDELKALAVKSGIILPAEYPADDKAHVDMMKKMTGAAFDKHYVDMMVTDHEKTIALFKTGARSREKEVSDFAKKTLPVIEGHFEKAKAIQSSIK